jgi:hypothetical protein
VPACLSSRPDALTRKGDKRPIWARVKPRDYRLWDQLMEKVAAEFADQIDVWEIWNEPNIDFWEGTVDEYAELVAHTSAALRRGDPDTCIAAGGFVGGFDFADRLFQQGMGDNIDILSVHYTDEKPGDTARWKELLSKYNLDLPIWNSEEKTEVPLRNMAGGIEKSFKFIHVAIGYPEFRPLVRKNLTALPAGVAFSVGAHCIGTAQHVGMSDRLAHVDTHFFQRGEETIAVFQRQPLKDSESLLGPRPTSVELSLQALESSDVMVTDSLGRSKALKPMDGKATLPLGALYSNSSSTPGMLIVNGARDIKITGMTIGESRANIVLGEAESGDWHSGWQVSQKEEFFGGRVLAICADKDSGPEGYWVRIPFELARGGCYEVIFSGNSLQRLKTPRSLSSFAWSFDDGPEQLAAHAHLPPAGFLGSLDGVSLLGSVELDPGSHTFQLRLTGRREMPDTHYALWFDAILLRPVASTEN